MAKGWEGLAESRRSKTWEREVSSLHDRRWAYHGNFCDKRGATNLTQASNARYNEKSPPE